MSERMLVSQEEMLRQREFMHMVRELDKRPQSYHIVSMGCQMNARDSESIAGMLYFTFIRIMSHLSFSLT